MCVVFVIVGFSHVCCLSRCCWFGCRCRDDRGSSGLLGCLGLLLTVSLFMESHFKPSFVADSVIQRAWREDRVKLLFVQ